MRELNGQPKQDLGATLSSGNSKQISEVQEMTMQEQNIQTGHVVMDQISGINPEHERSIEMLKTEKQSWFSRTLGNIAPVKLLAGLAVGAMLVTVIGLPTTGVSADEPSRPLGPGYYFELDVADGGSPGRDSLREIQGYGSVEDMNIAAQLQNRSAKLSPVGYGPAADIPSLPKLELKGYGPLADVISTPKAAQRGFGAIHDMTYAPKAEQRGFGAIHDMTYAPKAGQRGFGAIHDMTYAPKVGQRGFGAIHDMTYTPKGEQRGFGSLDDVGAAQR